MSFDLVLFGGTGDLAWRKLMPALFQAFRHGTFPHDGRILGIARDDLSNEQYRQLIQQRFTDVELSKRPSPDEFARFAELLHFQRLDLSKPGDYARLKDRLAQRNADVVLMYLATAPSLFTTVCRAAGSGRTQHARTRASCWKSRWATTSHPTARSTRRCGGCSARSRSSGSTTTWASRRCRTCSRCGSATPCSSRSGDARTFPTSRSRSPRTWASRSAARSTTAPARCATWCRTTRCSWSARWRWSRPSARTRTPSATRS